MEIIKFFLSPDLKEETTWGGKLSNAFSAFKFTVISSIVLVIALVFIHLVIVRVFNFEYSIMDTTKKFRNAIFSRTPLEIFFFGVVLIPLVEELTFRAFFDFRRISISLSVAGLIYILTKVMFTVEIGVGSAVVGFTISILALSESAVEFMRRNYRLLFYLSALLFVSLHVFNYNLTAFKAFDYFAMPVLLGPQIIGSMSYSFLRVRNGLVWSYVVHAVENMIFFLPFII
jgi:hypothetical protein